ncbi:transketolase [Pediococcus stilesii]|uniref:Transketolase n=1 Tax=Pediococcus stilesii TaxID=331679 RepID=A0A5R9BTB2_9LACO|nr:transketolase [Pediococcus stilesii]TLQ03855.1 transketolase [Pediococcus stilesii]
MKFLKEDMDAMNAIRFLSVDMIEKANSGHPGLPIDAAPMAYVLWENFLKFNPKDPRWINRDRFVLSAGHGSAMLYSLLNLNGFDLPTSELKKFRQFNSKTPGHPEYGVTSGIDATTGPLGQGLGMAVGMAMAEEHLASLVNRPGYKVFDHYTYALVGDGDLMEGISQEAINIAGQKHLNKLIVLYDSNDVSLDGPLSLSSSEEVRDRFIASGWSYEKVDDGNDLDQIYDAIEQAKSNDRPTIVEVKTIIGYGTPDSGTNKVHGNALGTDNIKEMRKFYNWKLDPFEVTSKIRNHYDELVKLKQKKYDEWVTMFNSYKTEYPEVWNEFSNSRLDTTNLSVNDEMFHKAMATRSSNSKLMQKLAKENSKLWGGSADLYSSNNTHLDSFSEFKYLNPAGKNIYFGVREFGMAAVTNGIALHGNTRPFASTFFVFSDYLKAGIRLAAIQHIPSIYIFTHDSIAVGEDGPTHEPVEQLAGLRSIPNVNVIRPADANEVLGAWQLIGKVEDRPSVLVLTRQNVPFLKQADSSKVEKGAYIISPAKEGQVSGILIATGSEVSLAMEVQRSLLKIGYNMSVVSMPSVNVFNEQSEEYREQVLPSNIKTRVSIEMGSSLGWGDFTGLNGINISIDRFGASGKGSDVIENYGFTAENIVTRLKKILSKKEDYNEN